VNKGPTPAFALVLVIALLGLLVLATYALSVLGRVNAQLGATSAYRTQARQNALMGLNLALGELQQHAGADDRITGMAGISGVPAGGNNHARHWSGVWGADGQFVRWLASGGEDGAIPPLTGGAAIALVATNSLGLSVTDREHVRGLRRQVAFLNHSGILQVQGNYAYWVGDDGVKLSLTIPNTQAVVPDLKHAIDQHFIGISPDASVLLRLLAYEQMNLAGATTIQRQGGFHSHTRTHQSLVGDDLLAGVLNVNTTSVRYWTGVGATFVRINPSAGATLSPAGFGTAAAALPGRPFVSVGDFFDAIAAYLTGNGVSVAEFIDTMQPLLAVRSDTFRIRAYGDVVNPVDPAEVEAVAYCEAIVQRTVEEMPGFGRRFVITHFRWLSPDEI
jgi:hypothetical protein